MVHFSREAGDFSLLQSQTDSCAHTASHLMDTGFSFPWDKWHSLYHHDGNKWWTDRARQVKFGQDIDHTIQKQCLEVNSYKYDNGMKLRGYTENVHLSNNLIIKKKIKQQQKHHQERKEEEINE